MHVLASTAQEMLIACLSIMVCFFFFENHHGQAPHGLCDNIKQIHDNMIWINHDMYMEINIMAYVFGVIIIYSISPPKL